MKLYNYEEWLQAEREFRLCKSLRVALRETETLGSKLAGRLSAKDWDALLEQMRSILAAECEVAEYVGDKFRELAGFERNAAPDAQLPNAVRNRVESFRDALIKERQLLILQEIELYALV